VFSGEYTVTLSMQSSIRGPSTFCGNREWSVSAFLPAYNDAQSLPRLVEQTLDVLEHHTSSYELIVVNDGSTDNTAKVLEPLQQLHGPQLRVITHSTNRGYGAALWSGFQAATKELVFYTDGDAQYDVGELPHLLDQMTLEVGLVNGYKVRRGDSLYRLIAGAIYNCLVRWLFHIQIKDVDCDFRLIKRSLLSSFELRSTSGAVCVELVRKLELTRCVVVEVPVRHYPRLYGHSEFFRLRSLFATLIQLSRLYVQLVLVPTMSTPRRAP
jgi:glycosyltransferase involved in cell wall biosynthesis